MESRVARRAPERREKESRRGTGARRRFQGSPLAVSNGGRGGGGDVTRPHSPPQIIGAIIATRPTALGERSTPVDRKCACSHARASCRRSGGLLGAGPFHGGSCREEFQKNLCVGWGGAESYRRRWAGVRDALIRPASGCGLTSGSSREAFSLFFFWWRRSRRNCV